MSTHPSRHARGRTVWIPKSQWDRLASPCLEAYPFVIALDATEFREVLPGEISITREDVARIQQSILEWRQDKRYNGAHVVSVIEGILGTLPEGTQGVEK